MRRVKALWNILSDAGREVAVVGWWATWPAETVRGAVVSDHTCYHFLFDAGASGSRDPIGVTHPPELVDEIAPLVRRPGDLTPEELARFVDVTPEELARPFDFQDDLSHFKWALATAQSYREIGLQLWKQRRPDVAVRLHRGRRLDLASLRPSLPPRASSRARSPSRAAATAARSRRCTATRTRSWARTSTRSTTTPRSSCSPTTASSSACSTRIRAARATCGA